MKHFLLMVALICFGSSAQATVIDPACTTTTNLSLYRCPAASRSWYQSYTGLVDELDVLSRTAKSSFTIQGSAFSVGVSSLIVGGGKVAISTPVGAGNLRIRAGTGNGGGVPPILLYSWSGSSYTHAASGWMLAHRFTVPANTLLREGDQLRVFAIAFATTTSLSKGMSCEFNGDDIESNYNTSTNEIFQQTNWVWYDTATNLKGYALKSRSGANGSSTTVNNFDEVLAWTSANEGNYIDCLVRSGGTGATGVDADMKFVRMEVWLETKP